MEVSIRTAHRHLVTRLQREYVGRSDTRHHIHEAYLRFRLEGRSGDTDSQHDAVPFCRIIRHRICTYRRFVILAFQTKQSELLPRRKVFLANQVLVNILVIIHGISRNLYLCIRTGDEVHVLTGRQCNDKLLDKGCHVLVGDDFALPLLDTHYRLGNLDAHVTFQFHLTAQAPMVLTLLTVEMRQFGRQNLTSTFYYLTLTLSTRALTSTSRRQVDAIYSQCVQQGGTGFHFKCIFPIDGKLHVARRNQVFLGHQQDDYQYQHNGEENRYTRKD